MMITKGRGDMGLDLGLGLGLGLGKSQVCWRREGIRGLHVRWPFRKKENVVCESKGGEPPRHECMLVLLMV